MVLEPQGVLVVLALGQFERLLGRFGFGLGYVAAVSASAFLTVAVSGLCSSLFSAVFLLFVLGYQYSALCTCFVHHFVLLV